MARIAWLGRIPVRANAVFAVSIGAPAGRSSGKASKSLSAAFVDGMGGLCIFRTSSHPKLVLLPRIHKRGRSPVLGSSIAVTRKSSPMIPPDRHLEIGSLLFEQLDQIDLTGPFEVFSRLPNSTCRIYAKTPDPVRDMGGLLLTPDAALSASPKLDVLLVPGGFGQEALMDDEEVLAWIRHQAAGALCVFSVCTGAFLCGAADLLNGKRATTHWSAFHLLPYFGATPVNERVVIDGNMVFAAGVTAGIDGALRVAAMLRGDEVARRSSSPCTTRPSRPS